MGPSCSSGVLLELVEEDDPVNRVFRFELDERLRCPAPVVGVGVAGMCVVVAGARCDVGPPLEMSVLNVEVLLLLVLSSDDESTESGGENAWMQQTVTATAVG